MRCDISAKCPATNKAVLDLASTECVHSTLKCSSKCPKADFVGERARATWRNIKKIRIMLLDEYIFWLELINVIPDKNIDEFQSTIQTICNHIKIPRTNTPCAVDCIVPINDRCNRVKFNVGQEKPALTGELSSKWTKSNNTPATNKNKSTTVQHNNTLCTRLAHDVAYIHTETAHSAVHHTTRR